MSNINKSKTLMINRHLDIDKDGIKKENEDLNKQNEDLKKQIKEKEEKHKNNKNNTFYIILIEKYNEQSLKKIFNNKEKKCKDIS